MIKIIGHRGCMEKNHTGQNLYENSLKALSFGLQHSDGIEFDCVRSADRDIFIVHDTVFDGIVQYELARHLTPESSAFLKGRAPTWPLYRWLVMY